MNDKFDHKLCRTPILPFWIQCFILAPQALLFLPFSEWLYYRGNFGPDGRHDIFKWECLMIIRMLSPSIFFLIKAISNYNEDFSKYIQLTNEFIQRTIDSLSYVMFLHCLFKLQWVQIQMKYLKFGPDEVINQFSKVLGPNRIGMYCLAFAFLFLSTVNFIMFFKEEEFKNSKYY